MKKFIFLFFLCFIGTQAEATIISMKSVCEGKKTETCQVFCQEKSKDSYLPWNKSTSHTQCKGLLDKAGHILVPKSCLEKNEIFMVSWSDEKTIIITIEEKILDFLHKR